MSSNCDWRVELSLENTYEAESVNAPPNPKIVW